MSIINRIMIALLLLALLYALYRYQQSCSDASINDKSENKMVEEIARADVMPTDQNAQGSQTQANSKEPLQIQQPKVQKRVQFAKKKDLIDDDSIDLDHISQMSLGSLNSNNTNLSLESRNSAYTDASDNMSQDSLFDNLSFGSLDSRESQASKDSFFFA